MIPAMCVHTFACQRPHGPDPTFSKKRRTTSHTGYGRDVIIGRIICLRLLGSDAVYRVVEESGSGVVAQVISAPGLRPGFRMRISDEAVRRMEAGARPRGSKDKPRQPPRR